MLRTLALLRQDNIRLRALLTVLERQVEEIERGTTADIEILGRVVEHFRGSATAIHHAREDIIHGHLTAYAPEAAKDIYGLVESYRKLEERLGELELAIRDIISGNPNAHATFCERARSFIQNERRIIEDEDARLLDYAVRNLPATEWVAIDREISQCAETIQ